MLFLCFFLVSQINHAIFMEFAKLKYLKNLISYMAGVDPGFSEGGVKNIKVYTYVHGL